MVNVYYCLHSLIFLHMATDFFIDPKEIVYKKLIGRGGFATVYKGKWKGKKVALKRINIPPGIDRKQMIASSCELNALKYASFFSC